MTELDTPVTHWSAEAEQSVIGAAMMDPSEVEALGLPPEAFFDGRNRAIWKIVLDLVGRCLPADMIAIYDQAVAGGHEEVTIEYLNQLSNCVLSATRISLHAKIVKEKWSARALVRALDEAMAVATGAQPLDTKMDRVSGLLAGLQSLATRRLPQSMSAVAARRTEFYEAVASGTAPPGWPTRIPTLDRFLNGGFRPGSMIVLAARPGVGKSSFSEWLAIELARQGLPSLILSQEMPGEELADRAFAAVGRVSYENISTGRLTSEDWERVAGAADEISQLPLYVDDQPALTLADIKAKARSVRGLKLLVVDYLQLCSGDGENRNSEIERVSRGLKALAKELQCAVIALSQLNRQVEQRQSKRPNLSDLRDSGAIEQDADVVLMLWPEETCVGCSVAKNRQGKLGNLALHFDGGQQRWGESTETLDRGPAPKPKGGKSFDRAYADL